MNAKNIFTAETRRRGEDQGETNGEMGKRAFGFSPLLRVSAVILFASLIVLVGCGAKGQPTDSAAGAPPPTEVEKEGDASLVKVDHPEQFPLITATRRDSVPELAVTGVVAADVSRNVPVISMASGRVLEIHARLGDQVTKGQLLMRVQSADISGAFSDYRKAVADEKLAGAQLDRAKLLLDRGAVPQKDLEVAQDAADKARVDVETASEHIRVLGGDIAHPTAAVDILAPVSGVVIEQNVTAAAGVKTLDNSPNLFTIADLSQVWILCDVYENNLAGVHEGEYADIHVNAYPNRVLRGRIDNIGSVMDPNLRTAKVRLQVDNPGFLRFGMFVTATFHGQQSESHAVVPATAVLHLHDRDWVYTGTAHNSFRRVEVVAGQMVPPNLQEIISGLKPGDRVVSNALVLQNTVEQ
jgi:cobalt-zinc-cadmium efflux system membrane fusion protein